MSDFSVLSVPADQAARILLGGVIERKINNDVIRVRIVEVEAYDQNDPASHARSGPQGRAKTMFGPAGHLYVYFSYGLHYCCNITAGKDGEGAGVLIRAVEPISGIDLIRFNRGNKTGVTLTNGPGKVCQALVIDKTFDGHDLSNSPITLNLQPPLLGHEITATKRVGVSKAADVQWRFYITGHPYVSYPR